MLACQNGHELCARAMIEAGANLEAQNNMGVCIAYHHCSIAVASLAPLMARYGTII